ncbi:MAG: anti-sigma factor [Nocardioides sp.]|uniref:anti-sigma factor n=1 Tax=Nocardioides sp. TaxID=35761 RepID=UPI003F0E243D
MAHETSHEAPERATVEVRLPAEGAYAAVLRTTAAGLAARIDFTMDDIEDLRMAIGEAIALLLPAADPGSDLVCTFTLTDGYVSVHASVEAGDEPEVDSSSFAWQVLDTLASDATAGSRSGRFEVSFTVQSERTVPLTGVVP